MVANGGGDGDDGGGDAVGGDAVGGDAVGGDAVGDGGGDAVGDTVVVLVEYMSLILYKACHPIILDGLNDASRAYDSDRCGFGLE